MLIRKAPGQLGGLPSRQTATGIHMIRLHSQIGRQRSLSMAIIFVDIKAAFHHMLREFIFTLHDPLTRRDLLQMFDDRERDVEKLAATLQQVVDEQVDDVPYALRDLVPLVTDAAAILHAIFHDHGLTLNLDKGKTEAVIMFRGPAANPQRTALFDKPCPPVLTVSTATHVFRLRIFPSYKQLGARFAMNADITLEVSARLSMIRAAFEEQKRAVFLNRHISLPGRQQLYSSLVLSRLMYGTAVWSRLSPALLAQIEASIIMHHRRIADVGFWNDQNMTDVDFRHKYGLLPFRIFLARSRLNYLQHVARQDDSFYHQLLLSEFASGHGWLHEVTIDLKWLSRFVELPFDIPETADRWRNVWLMLAVQPSWKAQIQRACDKFVLEEKIAWEVQYYHDHICQELQNFGVHIVGRLSDSEAQTGDRFVCSQCDAQLATRQQLALHSAKLHGYVTPERKYIQSTVCAGCLTDFHTSTRVLQHLRYRPNGCWDRIEGARTPDDPVTITLPAHLKNVPRLPAIRRHSGPLRPTSVQRQRIRLKAQIAALKQEGLDDFVWWHPPANDPLVIQVCQSLAESLQAWCIADDSNVGTFHDAMFHCLFHFAEPDMKLARIFIH
eukprot:s3609_g2.t1